MQKFLKYLSGYPGLILIFSCYVGLRLWQAHQILPFAGEYHDTINYMKTAEIPLSSVDFWGAIRPFITPLVFKIAALNPVWIGWLQACISIFCWGFLVYQATTFIKKPELRIAGILCLLLFSMVYNISGWDVQLLSESLALSFQALVLGMFFWLLRGWDWRKLIFTGLAAFLWSNTRDVNPWMLMSYTSVILLAGLLLKPHRRWIYLSIILGVVFLFSQWSVNYAHRWIYPYTLNVLPQRILTNRNAMNFFDACGMPANDNKDAYKAWLYSHGKYCFVRWVIANPTWTLTAPLNDWNVMLGFDPVEQYDYFQKDIPTLLPRPVERILYPAEYGVLFWWIGGVALGLMAASRLRKEPACILTMISFLLVHPFVLLSWHTDSLEIGRHVVQTQCLMFFSLWLMLLFLLDDLPDKLPRRPGNPIPEKETTS